MYDSNIWIEAKKLKGQQQKFITGEDHRVRIDMGKLGDVLAEGRSIEKGVLYGSEPPRIDTVWEKIKEKGWEVVKSPRNQISGKEKQVHTHLVADVVEIALTTPVEQRSTIILVTGDANVIPAIESIFKHDSHWNIEVFMWKNAISRKFTENDYGGRLTIRTLNECLDKVTFTNMKFDISNEALRNTVDESGVVFTMKSHAFPNHVPTYDWVKQLETITKWPFQYYWFTDDEQSTTDNLVVVFKRDDKAGKFNIDAFLAKLKREANEADSAKAQRYSVPMMLNVQTFKEFRENLEHQEKDMGQQKWVYYLEQPGQFSPQNVFQGFYNDAYIYYYKPIANIFQPYIEWYHGFSGVFV